MKDAKEETTYGLSPDRLAKLLALGLEDKKDQDELEEGQTAAELLEDMLSNKLPPEEVLGSDKTIGSLILDAETDLSVLETMKDYGKGLVRRSDSETGKAAATAIYYGSIASALVFHQRKISRHSFEKVAEACADLEEEPWIPSGLKDLFRKARTVCDERKRG